MNNLSIQQFTTSLRMVNSGGQTGMWSGDAQTSAMNMVSQGSGDFRQMLFDASLSRITVNASTRPDSFIGQSQQTQVPVNRETQSTSGTDRAQKVSTRNDLKDRDDDREAVLISKDSTTSKYKVTRTSGQESGKAVNDSDDDDDDYYDEEDFYDEEPVIGNSGDLVNIIDGTIFVRNLNSDEIAVVNKAIDESIKTIAGVMEVETEDVLESMDNLGLTKDQVLDLKNLPNIMAEVEETDVQTLLMDEDMYDYYKTLDDVIGMLSSDMADDLDINAGGEEVEAVLNQYHKQLMAAGTLDRTEESATGTDSFRTVTDTTGIEDTINLNDNTQNTLNTPVSQTDYNEGRSGQRNQGNRDQNGFDGQNGFIPLGTGNAMQGMMDRMTQNINAIFGQLMEQMTGSFMNSMSNGMDMGAFNTAAMDTSALNLSSELTSTQGQDIAGQISDFMKLNVKPDMTTMEMQLHPASLGNVAIQVSTSSDGNTVAKFVTQNETVRNAIESELAQLVQRFDEQGIKVTEIEVTVQPHAFEQNLEQNQNQNQNGEQSEQQSSTRASANRNINLQDLDLNDTSAVMSGEDQLAAEMMAAMGNSVLFSA